MKIFHRALDYVRQNDGDDDDNDECLCPTQQMACRWLREEKDYPYQFATIGTDIWGQCIPFEGNEHLLGTTDMPDEMYINW